MVKNYFIVAFRNLMRNKFYSFINIFGLVIGIACFTLITLFVVDEWSYDKFHSKADRIYRVVGKLETDGQGERSSSCTFPLAAAMKNDYGHLIEKVVRFFNFQEQSHTLQVEDIKFNEKRTFFVDSTLFDVFDFPLIKGNPVTALANPNSIIITQELAKKYFGDKDPLGKFIKYDGGVQLMVTGILADIPEQTHIHFDALISFSSLRQILDPNIQSKNWVWNPCWTYILLKPNVNPAEIERDFPNFIQKYYPDFIKNQAGHSLQPLTAIHLTSNLDYEIEANSSKSSIYIFAAIGIFILLIACINFTNLATARSATRAKEVGIRKVVGAHNSNLITQFLIESVLMGLIAVVVALGLVEILLPFFNSFSEKTLRLDFKNIPLLLPGIIFIGLLSGLFSGLYPAFFLSSFLPVKVLKGQFKNSRAGQIIRKSLVIGQFAISVILIICTGIIYKQLKFMQNADTGFNREQVLVLPVRINMFAQVKPFVDEIKKNKEIINVATMNDIIGERHNTHEFNYEGMKPDDWIYFPALMVNETFIETFDIKLLAGRGFSKEFATDDSLAVIINESMVKHLNWGTPENALGKQFYTPTGKEKVIGVVKDFNFESLVNDVGPFVLDIPSRKQRAIWIKHLAIRIGKNNPQATINFIENKWKEFVKDYPLEYYFLKDDLKQLYKAQENLSKLVAYFSVLAIFIACLGLFALADYTAQQRKKEIGIRKVLGASTSGLARLLSLDFLKLIVIANLIAFPLSFYLMKWWLQGFAFKTSISVSIFLLAGILTSFIALATVITQAVKASLSNPVLVLKYE